MSAVASQGKTGGSMSPLYKYLNQIFREALKYADKTVQGFDPEDIHKMRVALKKIKAAFYFEQFYLPQLSEEELKKSKKIFSDGGKIRELQLLKDAVKDFSDGNEITKEKVLNDLRRKEKGAKKKFHHHFRDSGKNALKALRKTMISEAKKLSDADFKLYFQSMLENIRIQIQAAQSEKDYHEFRKQLKELKYNLNFADEDSKRMVFAIFPEKELSQLEEYLGNWHDQVIIIAWLKKLSETGKTDVHPQPFFNDMADSSQQKADAMLKNIRKRLEKKE
jgi:CHAD domain-containing protein